MSEGVTQKGMRACDWKSTSKRAGTRLSRKASSEDSGARTETDTGRQEENSKVRGKTLVKELGKMYP